MVKKDTAIKVEGINKAFKLPHEKQTSVKSLFVNMFRRRTYERQQVLNDISFEIKKGEFFGIVGRNGSGKSTLLKLLAGIYSPEEGRIQIKGNLTPFIELGVGFNPELTGRENVFLNGALLGFNRKEIEDMYGDIVEFAELERFMDQKLKNYSSGMQVRLAFSIAIRAKSDILLIDEVLAVGDVNFQNKCLAVFEELKRRGSTIVFVSHDMEAVRRFCDKVVLIEKGQITMRGHAQKVIDEYLELNSETVVDNSAPFGITTPVLKDETKLEIIDTGMFNESFKKITKLNAGKYFLCVTVRFKKDMDNIVPGVILRNQSGIRVTASNSSWVKYPLPQFNKGDVVQFRFEFPNILEKGVYYISSNIVAAETHQYYDWANDAAKITVDRDFLTGGVVNPDYRVSFVKEL